MWIFVKGLTDLEVMELASTWADTVGAIEFKQAT
jgi:hypothetical protein